jgi:uncharacterized protein (DUF433 family)
MVDIYRTSLMTAREAARHLVIPESTLNVWLRADGPPLIHSVTPERHGYPRIPFVGIVEAHMLRAFRRVVSMADLRLGAQIVREELKDEYALASERFITDGAALFVELNEQRVIHARTGQLGIPELVRYFAEDVGRDDDGRLKYLRLRQYGDGAEVIIDPRFGWGSPVLAAGKVPVDTMVSLWDAGESIDGVAEEFDLSRDVVENVIRAAKRAA